MEIRRKLKGFSQWLIWLFGMAEISEEQSRIGKFKLPRIFIWGGMVVGVLVTLGFISFQRNRPTQIVQKTEFPQTVQEAKVQSVMESSCSTENNFEGSIWEKKDSSFRVLSRYGDTGDPEYYGAKTEEPFQSQMIYPFSCPLPFTTTASFVSKGPSSIGFQFEYEGVFQVILGDGDRRALRYKADTQGTRSYGWEYIKKDGRKITHWIPEVIKSGTEIELSISAKQSKDQIEVICSIKYFSEKEKKYLGPINFEPVIFKVESFDLSAGRQIRVGINDVEFKGAQAAIKFLHFSLDQE